MHGGFSSLICRLSSQAVVLFYQIDPAMLKAGPEDLWQDIKHLLGVGKSNGPTILSVDRAIGLIRGSIDWGRIWSRLTAKAGVLLPADSCPILNDENLTDFDIVEFFLQRGDCIVSHCLPAGQCGSSDIDWPNTSCRFKCNNGFIEY